MSENPTQMTIDFTDINLDTDANYRSRNGYDDESIRQLAASMMQQYEETGGARWLLQPIRVLEHDGMYSVHVGFRRMCAIEYLLYGDGPVLDDKGDVIEPTQNLWARQVPVVIDRDETVSLSTQLIENLQRKDPSPLDTALALDQMRAQGDKRRSTKEIGQLVGQSASWVQQHLRLLKLPEEVRTALEDGHITFAHARLLCSLSKISDQRTFLDKSIAKGWSSSQLESAIKRFLAADKAEASSGDADAEDTAKYAEAPDEGYVSTSTVDDADDADDAEGARAEGVDTSSGETPVGQVTEKIIPAKTLYVDRKLVGSLTKHAASDVKNLRKQLGKLEDPAARERTACAIGFHSAVQALLAHFAEHNDLAQFDPDAVCEALPAL